MNEDTDLLLKRLSVSFGISGLPLAWLTSYLSDRTASVLFCSSRSSWRHIPFGLPQGSVLGLLLYILFTAEIGSLLASCSLLSHSYADDVQVYKHCLASDARSAILSVSRATGLLSEWMSLNRLPFESFENAIYLAWPPPAIS